MFRARTPSVALVLVPALLTAVAYVDPGNFGTNIIAGAEHGYSLIWVVVLASATGALIQYLAAKLGLATGRSLAEHCADHLPRGPRILAWLQAEAIVLMTDLAEVVGGALGLYLLFGVPLPLGAVVIGVTSFLILGLRRSEGRGFRAATLGLLGVVVASVAAAVALLGPDWGRATTGLVPTPLHGSALLVAVGIIGATVMPHALYFHSAFGSHLPGESERHDPRTGIGTRSAAAIRRRIALSLVVAMGIAGVANVLILTLGVALPMPSDGTIEGVHGVLAEHGQGIAATLLGVALLAAGLASSMVGAWTGQVVMQGFLRVDIPWWVRRLVALAPPVVVLALGVDPGQALLLSQVVLSIGLPLTLLPLVVLTGRRAVMGALVNGRVVTVLAWAATAVITALDIALLVS